METIDPEKADEMVQRRASLVDVLSPFNYEHAHLPGAINLPVEDEHFPEKAKALLPDKMNAVIVYGQDISDDAGERAARRLEALGFANVLLLDGGAKAWWESGRPFDGDQVAATPKDPTAPRRGRRPARITEEE